MGLGLPFLAACSSDPNSDSSQLLVMARQSLGVFGDDTSVTRAQAAAIPYASIGVRLGDSRQFLLVLATQMRDQCLWTSAAHIAIETTSGRITRCAGLPHTIAQSLIAGRDPVQSRVAIGNSSCSFAVDLPDRNVYQARLEYREQLPRLDVIEILGTKLKVQRFTEQGTCPVLDWQFENTYWRDGKSGFVWRSVQNIHPDLDALEITVFRPPG